MKIKLLLIPFVLVLSGCGEPPSKSFIDSIINIYNIFLAVAYFSIASVSFSKTARNNGVLWFGIMFIVALYSALILLSIVWKNITVGLPF